MRKSNGWAVGLLVATLVVSACNSSSGRRRSDASSDGTSSGSFDGEVVDTEDVLEGGPSDIGELADAEPSDVDQPIDDTGQPADDASVPSDAGPTVPDAGPSVDVGTPDEDTATVDPDLAKCQQMCAYWEQCIAGMCTQDVLSGCVDSCLQNPATADQVLAADCGTVQDITCQSSGGPAVCDCPNSGGTTCAGIFECIQETCAEGDTACQQQCFNNASAAGQTDFNALQVCVQANCPEGGNECIFEFCADEANQCTPVQNLCFRECGVDSDCNADEFCFADGNGLNLCVVGTQDAPGVPENTQECNSAGSCPAGQICLSVGGG